MKQIALLDIAPTKASPYAHERCSHRECSEALVASEPQWYGATVNIDLTCPTHGKQITMSTRTDLEKAGAVRA